ncbi:helix-turn-helix domain-containing protein [Sphingorhabdus sp.]|jgi:excisionase family DNA binding protein|uniref:helix-turn-helix domain-containing protein n=1 Tax=Sphingorhabdus sp. TaxID=1902408 RepID=UPI0037CB4A91
MTLLTLSIADACLALSLSRTSIYKLIKQGRLKTLKIGSRTLLTVESIKALVEGSAS